MKKYRRVKSLGEAVDYCGEKHNTRIKQDELVGNSKNRVAQVAAEVGSEENTLHTHTQSIDCIMKCSITITYSGTLEVRCR